MKKFFVSLYRSTYDLRFLKARRFSRKNAWKYFSLFVLLFTFVYFVPGAVRLTRELMKFEKSVENVPEFSAVFKNGKLKVEKLAEPYVYSVSKDFSVIVDSSGRSVSSTGGSYLFLGEDKMEFYDASSGERSVQPWSKFPETNIDKASLVQTVQKAAKGPYLAVILVFLFVVSYVAIFVSKLYSIFVVSLVVFIMIYFRGLEWKWREIFTVSLFATTLPSIIETIFSLTPLTISYIHFIALLAFMLSVVFTRDEKKADSEI